MNLNCLISWAHFLLLHVLRQIRCAVVINTQNASPQNIGFLILFQAPTNHFYRKLATSESYVCDVKAFIIRLINFSRSQFQEIRKPAAVTLMRQVCSKRHKLIFIFYASCQMNEEFGMLFGKVSEASECKNRAGKRTIERKLCDVFHYLLSCFMFRSMKDRWVKVYLFLLSQFREQIELE